MIVTKRQSYDISRRWIEENPDALGAAEDGAEQCNRGPLGLHRFWRSPYRNRSHIGRRRGGRRAARRRKNPPFPRDRPLLYRKRPKWSPGRRSALDRAIRPA